MTLILLHNLLIMNFFAEKLRAKP